jgi:hypothetical protein
VIVADLLGKRVCVSRHNPRFSCQERLVTGIVRGVASTTSTTFTLLIQTEIIHEGGFSRNQTVGLLSAFLIQMEDNVIEVVLKAG